MATEEPYVDHFKTPYQGSMVIEDHCPCGEGELVYDSKENVYVCNKCGYREER